MRTPLRVSRLPIVVLILAAVASSAAHAAEHDAEPDPPLERPAYIGLEGGLGVFNGFDPVLPGVPDTGFEPGGAAVLRAGRAWRDHWRAEIQVGWHGSAIDSLAGRLDVVASTLGVLYDFSAPDAWVRPYLGVGVGVAGGWLDTNRPFSRRSGVGFAYAVEGGGRFRLGDRWWLACAWQFLGTAALIADGRGGDIDPTMHAFMVGLHRRF